MRRVQYEHAAQYCDHKSLDCDEPVDAYLSVHSLYYLSRDEVLQHLLKARRGVMVAVVHRFSDLYGSFHTVEGSSESLYETFVEGDRMMVTMKVNGNFTGYTHDPCHWLNSTYFESGGNAMCWTGRPVGDSWIITFRLVPKQLVGKISVDTDRPLSLVTSLKRSDHYGCVGGVLSLGDESTYKPMLGLLKINLREIHSCGPYMWLGMQQTRSVLVPKGLIESVAIKMVGVPRNKDSLRLCINFMKLAVKSDKLSIPVQMRADCVIYGSSLAFVLFVREEIQSFNRICTPYHKRLYERLSNSLSLEHWSWACCWGTSEDEILTVTSYNTNRSSVAGPAFDAKLAWPKGLPGYESGRELRTIRPKAHLKSPGRDLIEDKPQFYPVCTTFSNYIPLVPYASVNNETVSLVNRALMVVPKPEPQAWVDVHTYAQRYVGRFKKVDLTDPDRNFLEWNSRFPKARALAQRLAYETLATEPLENADFIRKAFCKRELTMKGGAEPSDFDPRAIQGNTHRLNAAYGPFTHMVSAQLKTMWHINHEITYTGGLTAEEIGQWRAGFEGDVTIVECDEERYDCHQGEDEHRLYCKVESKCGAARYPNVPKAQDSMLKISGWSSHGVKYSVDYTMTSGAPSTSTRNSFVNGVKTACILKKLGYKFRMLVHGDDSLIVIRFVLTDSQKEVLMKELKGFNKRLGFSTKVKISHSWHEVEYCSSLFWPVQGGYVLGPKIGKRLPKIGFSLRKLKVEEVKGMLIGLQLECGYVPVLRKYATHSLGLVGNIQAKEFHDDRRYKSLPVSQHAVGDNTKMFFYERYGVDVDTAERLLEEALTENLTDCVRYDLLDEFVKVDL